MDLELKNKGFCDETMDLKHNIEGSFLELGKRLQIIRDERKFEPAWETFEDYLIEMRMSKGTASKLINIFDVFVLQHQIPLKQLAAVGWSPLAEILPVVNSKQEAEHWVHVATENPLRELRDEIREHRTGIDQSKCGHIEGWVVIKICKKCKMRQVIEEK